MKVITLWVWLICQTFSSSYSSIQDSTCWRLYPLLIHLSIASVTLTVLLSPANSRIKANILSIAFGGLQGKKSFTPQLTLHPYIITCNYSCRKFVWGNPYSFPSIWLLHWCHLFQQYLTVEDEPELMINGEFQAGYVQMWKSYLVHFWLLYVSQHMQL